MPVTSKADERASASRAVLGDNGLLERYIARNGTSQSALARAAGTSRQFIHQLVTGTVTGCTKPVADRIEEHLNLLPGTLFAPAESSSRRRRVVRDRKVSK